MGTVLLLMYFMYLAFILIYVVLFDAYDLLIVRVACYLLVMLFDFAAFGILLMSNVLSDMLVVDSVLILRTVAYYSSLLGGYLVVPLMYSYIKHSRAVKHGMYKDMILSHVETYGTYEQALRAIVLDVFSLEVIDAIRIEILDFAKKQALSRRERYF